ncbi:MAG: GNAT family N-acetyltransferase [Candidatus Hodarchaeales archaeon]|jgi:ribosomal protein S18 acetylase RimI-like enzyme
MLVVKIRDYFANDFPSIETIIRVSPELDNSIISHEKRLIDLYIQQYTSGRIFVAIDNDNNIVGYMILRYFRQAFFIENLVVDPKVHRQGVGSQLLDFAKKLAQLDAPNLQILRVSVLENLHGIIEFFFRNEFQIAGYVRSDTGLNINQVHLVYPLVEDSYSSSKY